jgi:multicomponent Na+:H+ antiporter subunit D
MVSSLLNIGYLLPIVARGFFLAPDGGPRRPAVREAPLFCVVPLCVTAVGCVALFFFADEIYGLLEPIARRP